MRGAPPPKRPCLYVPKSNYELFNRNSFSIHSWSWNYRGCWHQTCPPIVTLAFFCFAIIPITQYSAEAEYERVLVFVVTTSPCRHRVIYAPAAFLGSGSRFSGSLSGIEPLFPVTRHKNGRPLSYQPLDRSVIQLVCRHEHCCSF